MKSKKKVVKSNLRWPGGKSKMTRILDKYMPDEVNRYLEVFTGGGSVLLHVLQKYEPVTSYANDIEKGLIAYYERVKNNPEATIRECLDYKDRFTSETFRNEFYNLDRTNPVHFFISNKTSFSGMNNNYSKQAYDHNFFNNNIL